VLGGIIVLLQQMENKPFNWVKLLLNGFVYSVTAAIPFLFFILLAASYYQFDLFWKWVYTYPKNYISVLTPQQGWANFSLIFEGIIKAYTLLWIAGGIGFITFFFDRKKNLTYKIFLIVFVLISMMAVVPGYYFRDHYFILLLPVLSFCTGYFFSILKNIGTKYISASGIVSVVIYVLIVTVGISSGKDFYFNQSADEYSHFRYFHNPFREAIVVGDYLKTITNDTDKIQVFGSEGELYYYSHREAASGYLFMYDLVSKQPKNLEMQKEFISEVEKNKPEAIVFAGVNFSWVRQPNTPDSLFKWFDSYVKNDFEITGIADMADDQTIYKWGTDAQNYQPTAENYLVVFKRKKNQAQL
jgi:hypothetical protein